MKEKKEKSKEKRRIEVKNDKTGKKFWNRINSQRKRRERVSKEISMSAWIEHFKEQLGAIENVQKQDREDYERQKKKSVYEEENKIETEEIRKIIRRMKRRKAPGEDGIPNEAWIYGEDDIEDFEGVLTKIWKGEESVPEEWKCGVVTPIYKKGEKEKAKNYRGITLMDTAYKIYAEILRNRLEEEIEEKGILEDTQTDYRKRIGTIDAVYMVKTAIEEEIKKNGGEVYIFFADMIGALRQNKKEKNMEAHGRRANQ